MRKYIIFYNIGMIFLFLTIIMFLSLNLIMVGVILSIVGILFGALMILPMIDVKWHLSREKMLADQKESARVTRNATELVEKIKKILFQKNIMTKEKVFEILNKK